MGLLVYTDDELALLRFTCDLFFVEESPLYYLEAEPAEPMDYAASYRSLVDKKAIDPAGFRITDEALNRLAPITECDARLVHLLCTTEGVTERDYYLLDEIAVPYQAPAPGTHAVGPDMDHGELLDHLARRMEPRRAAGDRVELTLTGVEYLALCRLSRPLDGAATPGDGSLRVDRQEARHRLGTPPPPVALDGASPSRLAVLAGRRGPALPTGVAGLVGADVWDAALEGLLQRTVLRLDGDALVLRPGLQGMVAAIARAERHTFVRYDFGEDEWLMRETSFLPADGTLFFLGSDPTSPGELRVSELDGQELREALRTAVGPLSAAADAKRRRPFRAVLVGSDDDVDHDTEIADPLTTAPDPSRP